MPKSKTPLQIILAMLPSLNEKNKEKLRKALKEKELSPCEKNGHKLKLAKTISEWFKPTRCIYVCEKCGKEIEL